MKTLTTYLDQITAVDETTREQAQARLDNLLKPPGSLGELENMAVKLAGITGEVYSQVDKKAVVIMAADHGVVEAGVSSAPQVVTYTQTLNFTRGITGVTVLAKLYGADVHITDVGIKSDEIRHPQIINKKIKKGTHNMTKGPAMTKIEAERAILVGIETAIALADEGYQVLAVGEMGIGNTTAASAVLATLGGVAPELVTGKGAGLSEEGYQHKIATIKKAIGTNKPDATDVLDVLAKVGGLEIAAMVGVYIGCAVKKIPAVMDGFISSVSALCAVRLNKKIADYLFASHTSVEIGHEVIEQAMGLTAPLKFNMRLGEGSGAVMLFPMLEAACAIIKEMGTFAEGNIDESYVEEINHESFRVGGL